MSVESRTHPSDLSALETYGGDRVRHQRCRINLVRECGIIVMLLVIVSTSKLVSCAANNFEHCESTVLKWAASSSDNGAKEDRLTLKDLLFFLHVPRTGGRTYFYCFLKKLYPTSQECPRSYDKLRFDPSKPNCSLVVTHDDYSLMSKLPKERTSVVTILRNPVDRVFSTYEFSVEVAARFLVHPNLTSVSKMSLRLRSSKKHGVSTLDIWPWKYLVPWMVEDLFGRRATRKYRLDLLDIDKDGDTYNMEDFVMPLHDFINNPMAHDLIHNGATFQVAGLTNNSCLAESNEIRLCVREHPSLGRHVLDVAKKRLDDMLYVGLTEDHKQSATMFSNMVGAQVLSQLETLNLRTDDESTNSTGSRPYSSINLQNRTANREATEVSAPENVEQANGNMTVAKLMEAYEVCVSNTRKSQATRRINSLKQISPVNFSKEARLQVPETLLQEIQSLNSLDMELYKHAQDIFRQQGQPLNQKLAEVESQTNLGSNVLWFSPWKALMMVTILFLFLFIFIVNKRRRTSKIKI